MSRSAVICTIIGSCRSRGIDPYEYLRDVLTRLPSMTTGQIKDITPGGLGEGTAGRQSATVSVDLRGWRLSDLCSRQSPLLAPSQAAQGRHTR